MRFDKFICLGVAELLFFQKEVLIYLYYFNVKSIPLKAKLFIYIDLIN
jgi:hypothetical protein